MIKREKFVPVGVGVVIVKQGKILIGRRTGKNGYGTWSMPGGHLDVGESPEETAIRETLEETGVTIHRVKFVGYTNDIFPEKSKHYITLWIAGEWLRGEPYPTETHEMDSFKWVSLDELPEPLFLPFTNLLQSQFASALRNIVQSHLL